MITVNIPKQIDQSTLDSIVASALEGGIIYWAIKSHFKNHKDRKKAEENEVEFASDAITRGYPLIITTDEEEKYELNFEKLKKGIEKFLELWEFDYIENHDANVADVIIQYALFGEVVYG